MGHAHPNRVKVEEFWHSDGERAKVLAFARAVGLDERELLGLEGGDAGDLMQQMSHIDDVDALE